MRWHKLLAMSAEEDHRRLKVLKTFLRTAVLLSKLHAFRDLLKENMFHLTDRRHKSDLVPFIFFFIGA